MRMLNDRCKHKLVIVFTDNMCMLCCLACAQSILRKYRQAEKIDSINTMYIYIYTHIYIYIHIHIHTPIHYIYIVIYT